nr:MAG TPA: hypothetical protein [Caudoviricetes sp.]
MYYNQNALLVIRRQNLQLNIYKKVALVYFLRQLFI